MSIGQTCHLGSSSIENKAPVGNLELPDEENFRSWLRTENEIIEWNLIKTRYAQKSLSKLPETTVEKTLRSGRSTTTEWTKYFQCSFGGMPRARSEGSSGSTSSRSTRKVGCHAKIKAQKLFSGEIVYVMHLNSHSGHNINDLQT